MSRQKFKHINFRPETRALISVMADIVDEYIAAGYVLTLRQLYYQAISRDILPNDWIDVAYNRRNGLDDDTKNTEKNYKRLGGLVSDMRMCGLLDWDAIVDRGREPHKHIEFMGVRHRIESAIANYRLPRWDDQDWYAELWVEKDALAGVLEPLADEAHCVLMVNKGYSSQSAMYASAHRFMAEPGRGVLFYLGDFDPSGEDMVRDIRERLHVFGASDLQVRKIGLTMDQIRKYRPPPNPAKITDPRAGVDKDGNITNPNGYVAKHGTRSWEVDALDVEVLCAIVRSALATVIDEERMDAWKAREEHDKNSIKAACAQLMKEAASTPEIPKKAQKSGMTKNKGAKKT